MNLFVFFDDTIVLSIIFTAFGILSSVFLMDCEWIFLMHIDAFFEIE